MSKLSSACAQVAADALFAASVDSLLVLFYKPDGPGAAVIVTRAGKAVFTTHMAAAASRSNSR